MNQIITSSSMKCPHCFLELRLMLQYNKEVDQCPKCEGIWLDKDNSENMFAFTEGDKKYNSFKIFKILLTKIKVINCRMIITIIKSNLWKMKNLMICLILNNLYRLINEEPSFKWLVDCLLRIRCFDVIFVNHFNIPSTQ